MISIRSPLRLLGSALALGVCADLLFYGRWLGISLALFTGLCLAAAFALARLEAVRPAWRNAWLAVPLLFFAVMGFVRASAFLTALNILACLILLGLLIFFFAAGRVTALDWFDYPLALLRVAGNALAQPASLLAGGANGKGLGPQHKRTALSILAGVALTIPLLCVFIVLFSSADLIFARYVRDIVTFNWNIDLLNAFWQVVLVACVAWLGAGGLAYALTRRERAAGGNQAAGPAGAQGEPTPATAQQPSMAIGFVESVTMLTLIDLLFLGFVLIQVVYLFGGARNINVEGYTYAEYARRGFFELVAVGMLTLSVVWGLDRLARRSSPLQRAAFLVLSIAMIGMVMVILASAIQRLNLYESVYGYTALRLYSHAFAIWMAGVFVLFVVTLLAARPRLFVFGGFLAGMAYLLAMNLLNPDALIAQQNIQHYARTGRLDGEYLATLSEDAVPVVIRVLDVPDETAQAAVSQAYLEQLTTLEKQAAEDGWPSFHLARYNALAMLQANRERLEEKSVKR
jgi:hypothetical protein